MKKSSFIRLLVASLLFFAVVLVVSFMPIRKESLPKLKRAQIYCGQKNVAAVSINDNFIKVASSLLGGGATYYSFGEGQPFTCPVVGPEAMSEQCKKIMALSNWQMVCTSQK